MKKKSEKVSESTNATEPVADPFPKNETKLIGKLPDPVSFFPVGVDIAIALTEGADALGHEIDPKRVVELIDQSLAELPVALARFRQSHGCDPLCLVVNPTAPALTQRRGFPVELDPNADPSMIGLVLEKTNNTHSAVMWFSRTEWEGNQ